MYLTKDDRRRMAGEVMLCGFEGTGVGPELKEIMREVSPLGLVLFSRNLSHAEDNMEFCRELKSLRPKEPALLCVDQEGGRVARLKKSMTLWPPMAVLGRMHQVAPKEAEVCAYRVGEALAKEVRTIGFDIDFAPVLDVHTNPDNPIIGDRAFSTEPGVVAALGAAFIRGMQDAGVGASGKHFPGHGDTHEDSHIALPKISHDIRRLRQVEWLPFVAAIKAQVSSIMTAHVVVEPVDPLPATLSPIFLTQHLRGELGYQGTIVSDDIDMKGLFDHFDMEAVGPMGLAAGVDVFLGCRSPEAIMALFRGIIVAAEKGVLPHKTLAARAAQARRWRAAYSRPAVGAKEGTGQLAQHVDGHRQLVDQLASYI